MSPRGDIVMDRDSLGGVTRYSYDGERHLTRSGGSQGPDDRAHLGRLSSHLPSQKLAGERRSPLLRYDREGELVEASATSAARSTGWRSTIRSGGLEASSPRRRSTGGGCGMGTTGPGRVVRYSRTSANEITSDLEYDLAGRLLVTRAPLRRLHRGVRLRPPRRPRFARRGPRGRASRLRGATRSAGWCARCRRVGGEEHWSSVDVRCRRDERTGRTTSLGHTEAVTRGGLGRADADRCSTATDTVDHTGRTYWGKGDRRETPRAAGWHAEHRYDRDRPSLGEARGRGHRSRARGGRAGASRSGWGRRRSEATARRSTAATATTETG